MDIKEIALKVADSLRNKVDGISHMQSNQGLVRFAEALVAEIQRQNEPVAGIIPHSFDVTLDRKWVSENIDYCEPLFTFPPAIEALEDKVAEACADMCNEYGFAGYCVVEGLRSGEWKKFKKGE